MSSSQAVSARRNGKKASCEPCRKSKIRCDHSRPTCGRCEKRGTVAKCYYHPNPLTRGHTEAEETVSLEQHLELNEALVTHDLATVTTPASVATPKFYRSNHARQLRTVAEILLCLNEHEVIRMAVDRHVRTAQVGFVPGPLLAFVISSLGEIAVSYRILEGELNTEESLQKASRVLEATSKSVALTPDLDYKSYANLFISDHLRLEMLGLLLVLTNRILIYNRLLGIQNRLELVHSTYQASISCFEIARDVAPEVNDVMAWMAYELLRSTTLKMGNLHPSVCFRLGDISSCAFMLGAHRESSNTNSTPFFIAEMRRKLWCCLHHIDKQTSVMFDHPPRIMGRYVDCRMPLDLTEEEVLGDSQAVSYTKANLTSDGWSVIPRHNSATWCRMRFTLSGYREKTLEYQHLPLTDNNVQQLRNLAEELHRTWEALPSHLHYRQEIRNEGYHPEACLMVGIVHLLYLHMDFQIHRILQKRHSEALGTLIQICAEMMDIFVHLGGSASRSYFLIEDNVYAILGYGVPCAAVLVNELSTISRNHQRTIPVGLVRSQLLRNLSIFISFLQTICEPGAANYEVCTKAASTLGTGLDNILDPPLAAELGQQQPALQPENETNPNLHTPISTRNERTQNRSEGFPTPSIAEQTIDLPDLGLDAHALDLFDFDSWMKGIDWTAATSEWLR